MTNAAGASAPASHRVARNVTIMMLGQVLGMPLAMLVNIFMGRRLGPGDYGQYDLLTTFEPMPQAHAAQRRSVLRTCCVR